MATYQSVLFSFPDSPNFFSTASDQYNFESRLRDHLSGMASGAKAGSIACTQINNNAVAASGTFTFSGAASTNDTVLINGVTFTCVASSPGNDQFLAGVSATTTAANLAAAVVASTNAIVNTTVTASSALGVCTITAKTPGAMGNAVTIAKGTDSGSVDTVSGARLTGGANDTSNAATFTYHFGY